MARQFGGPILILGLVCTGCPDRAEGPAIGYTPEPPVDIMTLGLPTDDAGRPILAEVPGATLVYDAEMTGPATALAACSRWVVGCYDPGTRSLDACFGAVPRCTTDTPWEESAQCCPAACATKYDEARKRDGLEPYPALHEVLFEDGSCMPGLREMLGKAP